MYFCAAARHSKFFLAVFLTFLFDTLSGAVYGGPATPLSLV